MTDYVSLSATSWRTRVKSLTEALIGSILPPICVNCKKVGKPLCAGCLDDFPRPQEPICPRCGRTTSQSVGLCFACRRQPPVLEQVRAAALFSGAVPRVIHKMKYEGMFALADPLASLMAVSWPVWQMPVSLVVPVPLHPEREKSRGYNQSRLLADHLCGRLGFSCDPAAVQRIRHTRPQVELTASERQSNVAGAFRADPQKVKGESILLIDDVCTTGSTLSEVAAALLAAGAKRVSGYCLARAV